MSAPAPANGPDQWFVKVKETVYGPYSFAVMRKYIAEGRVASQSMVCEHKAGAFRPAGQTAPFSALFQTAKDWKTAAIVTESPEANLVVCADFVTGGVNEFGRILQTLGPSVRIGQTTWVLRSTLAWTVQRYRVATCRPLDDPESASR